MADLDLAIASSRNQNWTVDVFLYLLFGCVVIALFSFKKKTKNKFISDLAEKLTGTSVVHYPKTKFDKLISLLDSQYESHIEFQIKDKPFKVFFEEPTSGGTFIPSPASRMELIYELKKNDERNRIIYTDQNMENRKNNHEINRIFDLKYFEMIEINSLFIILRKHIKPPQNAEEINVMASAIKNHLGAIIALVEKTIE